MSESLQTSAETSALAVLPLSELLQRLNSSVEGLSTSAADAIRQAVGANRVDSAKRRRLFADLIGRFRNPLVLILLGAGAVSAFTGDAPSFLIIAFIVLGSVILDVAQERRAENAAEQLREQVALTARTVRDGAPIEIPAAELVPGDIVLLAAGDLVPADARLMESRDLYVNEALLTGESYPAEKNQVPPDASAPSEAALPGNLVFMGTSVVSGTAKVLIVATGRRAQLGAIAGSLQRPPPPTAFAVGVEEFGVMILRLTIFMVLFVLLINVLFHRPPLQSFLFALALAVGLTPELMPMIVSVTLAHGALRMARKEVIVKRQSAIYDLGTVDVLCCDKTGTLTEAHIKLVRGVDLAGLENPKILQMAQLNAAFETGLKSPLDEAILAAGPMDLRAWRKIDEVPFDFERRRVSILAEGGGRRLLIVKGAPEDILGIASHCEQQGIPAYPLDSAARDTAKATFNALGSEGYRVLAVAWREVESHCEHAALSDETELTFAGFLAFLDPPKAGAREAITALAQLGVRVKVVSGDNEHVTRHVCG